MNAVGHNRRTFLNQLAGSAGAFQDNAGQDGGDAMVDSRANFQGLVKVLS